MSRRNKNVSQNGLQSTALHRARMHDARIRPSVGKNFKNFHPSTFLLGGTLNQGNRVNDSGVGCSPFACACSSAIFARWPNRWQVERRP